MDRVEAEEREEEDDLAHNGDAQITKYRVTATELVQRRNSEGLAREVGESVQRRFVGS